MLQIRNNLLEFGFESNQGVATWFEAYSENAINRNQNELLRCTQGEGVTGGEVGKNC